MNGTVPGNATSCTIEGINNNTNTVNTVTFTQTSVGWKQRSLNSEYNNDYVSGETIAFIIENWLPCDFDRCKVVDYSTPGYHEDETVHI